MSNDFELQNAGSDGECVEFSRRRLLKAGLVAAAGIAAYWPQAAEASSLTNGKTLAPQSGSQIWLSIPDPKHSGQYLKSFINDGSSVRINSVGLGQRSARWNISGLDAGYYRIEIYYYKNKQNAATARVQCSSLYGINSNGWHDFPKHKTLDMRVGDGNTAIDDEFVMTSTNLTPYSVSNKKSYIWLDLNKAHTANSGVLSVLLSDLGCGTAKTPGGFLVADTIKVTYVSNKFDS